MIVQHSCAPLFSAAPKKAMRRLRRRIRAEQQSCFARARLSHISIAFVHKPFVGTHLCDLLLRFIGNKLAVLFFFVHQHNIEVRVAVKRFQHFIFLVKSLEKNVRYAHEQIVD